MARLVTPLLVRRLLDSGLSVAVCVSPEDPAFAAELTCEGAFAVPLRPFGDDRGLHWARNLLAREALLNARVVLSFHNLALSLFTRARGIVVLHDVIPLEGGRDYATRAARLRLALRWRWNVRRAAALVHISQAALTAARSQLGSFATPTYLAPNSSSLVGKAGFHPHELGLPSHAEAYVLVHGGTEPRKDVRTAVEAHRRLPPPLRARFPLIVLGEQWHGRGWEQTIEDPTDPFVHRAGHVADSRYGDILASARAVLCTSRLEGFDLPLLDSMRLGVPVVASRIDAHVEVAGESASLAPAGDVQAFAARLERALIDDDTRAQVIASGRERARLFTIERCVAGYEAAIRHALEG